MNPRRCGVVRTGNVDAPTIAQNVGASTIEQMSAGQNVGRRNVRGPSICTFVSNSLQKYDRFLFHVKQIVFLCGAVVRRTKKYCST